MSSARPSPSRSWLRHRGTPRRLASSLGTDRIQRPLLNTAAEALAMLCERPELDYVLIEEWLFDKEKLECA